MDSLPSKSGPYRHRRKTAKRPTKRTLSLWKRKKIQEMLRLKLTIITMCSILLTSCFRMRHISLPVPREPFKLAESSEIGLLNDRPDHYMKRETK